MDVDEDMETFRGKHLGLGDNPKSAAWKESAWTMEGMLSKRLGDRGDHWQDRYFVLKGDLRKVFCHDSSSPELAGLTLFLPLSPMGKAVHV